MPAHLYSVLHGGSISAVVGAVSGDDSGMPLYVPVLILAAVVAAVIVLIVVMRRRAGRRAPVGVPAAGTGSAAANVTAVPALPAQPAVPGVPAVASAPPAPPAAPAPALTPALVHPKSDPVVITTPHLRRTLATMTVPLTTAIPIVPTTATGSVSTGRKTVLDYIDERTIVLDVDETDRDRMINTLAGMMSTTGRIADVGLVAQAAFRRETHGTTSMGNGIAIAHAKCEAVLAPVLAFARSRQGIDWNSPDGEKATLIFMIAVPKASAGTEHLRVLSQLSRCLTKPAFRAAIQAAQTPAAVLEALAVSAHIKRTDQPSLP
jgi:PTS system fructose-specific IIC component